jgi:hypothetical protein
VTPAARAPGRGRPCHATPRPGRRGRRSSGRSTPGRFR